jgi:hypothetical protein
MEGSGAVFQPPLEDNWTDPTEKLVASITLDDLEPSSEFQEDVALIQNTEFELNPLVENPPPIPTDFSCDW